MSDPALRRTIRRCTAVLVLALAATLSTVQTIVTQGGSATASLPTQILFVGSSLYLLGSVGRSLLGDES